MRSVLFAGVFSMTTFTQMPYAFAASEAVHTAGYITSGWAKASHPRAFKVHNNGVAYIQIENKTDAADTIVSVSSPHARVTEIHEMGTGENGLPFMRKVKDMTLDAGETMHMAPGGIHLMLIDMDEPIAEGDIVTVTVSFEHAGDQTVELKAYPFRSKGPEGTH